MLREALLYILTPTTPIAKKYGFLYSSIALKARYERCKRQWLPHLKNCQDLFINATHKLSKKDSVVILGSAHLHEVPLHLLVENFKKITLVDVIHPLEHHRLAKRNSNIELVTMDLSMSLDKLDHLKNLEDLHELIANLQKKELFHFDADLIVSGNILSQLALLPIDAMERKLKRKLSIEEKDLLCTAFGDLHVQNLLKCRGKKVIYSDRVVTYRDPQGEVIYEGHYPIHFDGFKKIAEWIWLIAPLKEASKDYSIEMKIEAYES